MKKTIYFITGNENKIREAEDILANYNIKGKKILLPEIQGTRQEIIKEKIKTAAKKFNKEFFVEDTCLYFEVLNGLPGPYIKDFLKSVGNKDLPKLIYDFKDKRAKVVCSIGYYHPKRGIKIFEAIVEGEIVQKKGNKNFGFGWDPIFQPKGHKKTYAQMSSEEKNKISHRRKALEKLNRYLHKD